MKRLALAVAALALGISLGATALLTGHPGSAPTSTTTAPRPQAWPTGTLARSADVKAALALVGRYDPARLRRMERQPWELGACPLAGCPYDTGMGATYGGPSCATLLDLRAVRADARPWGVSYRFWLAVTLVHEWTHCGQAHDDERPAVRAELAFERKVPTREGDRAEQMSTLRLSLINSKGEWKWTS